MFSRLVSVASRLASTTASSSSIRARRVAGGAPGPSTGTGASDTAAAGAGAARGVGAGTEAGADLAPSSATTRRLYSLTSASTDAGGFAQALSLAG